MIVIIWLIAALATWLAMLGFTDFVLWDDDPVTIIIGMIVAAFLCVFFWPFVLLAAIGTVVLR